MSAEDYYDPQNDEASPGGDDFPDENPAPQQALTLRNGPAPVGPAMEPSQIQAEKAPITAAQAKVEAVASLTMHAYERAAMLELTSEQIKGLQQDFPDEAFKPGAAGKEHLIYIEHAFLRDRLNQVIGIGRWALVPRSRWAEPFRTARGVDGSRVYVEAMLVVQGCFVAEAVGEMEYYPSNAAQNYGDAVEGAKTAALRRCCKEFGIGLQAWKKDWCEGWWQRRRSGVNAKATYTRPGSQNAPQTSGSATPPVTGGTPFRKQEAPTATQGTPKTELVPTEEGKKKMIALLCGQGGSARAKVTEYFVQAGIILPTETLEDIPLHWCPRSKHQMLLLSEKVVSFANSGVAEKPYPPNDEPGKPKAKKEPKNIPAGPGSQHSAPPIEVPRDKQPAEPSEDDGADEWFMKVIVPVPRKGMRRDEYMRNPDTIGSLYASRHGTTDEDQVNRQRLFGFVSNYEPKGWTKRDGTEMPPSEADINFRGALDAFVEWFESQHPDEKL